MDGIELSPRLRKIAELVPPGYSVADVGTDHGYLAVWLFQKGISDRIVASDIGRGPLSRAMETVDRAGIKNGITLKLCDGLNGITQKDAEIVIIAGMGGETIAGILSEAPWTKNCKKLLLQPMTKVEYLRRWLYESGFIIEDERLVKDSGKLYSVISASGGSVPANPKVLDYIVHPSLISDRDELLVEYIEIQIGKLNWSISGLKKSTRESDAQKLAVQCKAYDELVALKESLKNG